MGMEGEQLGKGGGLWGSILLCRCGDQDGADAKACEESIEIEWGGIGRGGGGKDSVVVVVVEFAFVGSQGLVRLEGEVCPEVEVGREVGEGGSEVLGVLLDGVDDVEAAQVEGRHGGRGRATF